MTGMTVTVKKLAVATVAFAMLAGVPASAQIVPPVTNPVPPPPALPPPSMDIPKVPKMDAPPQQPSPKGQSRSSFGDRINDCLTDTNSARLNSTQRAAYSRNCANRQ